MSSPAPICSTTLVSVVKIVRSAAAIEFKHAYKELFALRPIADVWGKKTGRDLRLGPDANFKNPVAALLASEDMMMADYQYALLVIAQMAVRPVKEQEYRPVLLQVARETQCVKSLVDRELEGLSIPPRFALLLKSTPLIP